MFMLSSMMVMIHVCIYKSQFSCKIDSYIDALKVSWK